MKRFSNLIAMSALTLAIVSVAHGAATEPATQASSQPTTQASTQAATVPAGVLVLKASDVDEIAKAEGKKAAITGEIDKAEWSKTGKVFTITFKDVGPAFKVAVLVKDKEPMDAAFDGDIAKALKGKTICVTGKIQKYQGNMEILADSPKQIVIVGK